MKKLFIVTIFITVFAIGCNKDDDDFMNLKSTLKIENTIIGALEGKYLYINLSLSDELSKDLILKADFSTEGVIAYINDEDYKKELEYSTDGKTWQKETNTNQVKFKSRTSNLKIRIPTIDDDLPETKEEFKLTLTPIADADLSLTNELSEIKVSVVDNEVNKNPDEKGMLMEFAIADGYTGYTVTAIQNQISSSLEKEVIDEKYKRPVEDALKAFKLLSPSVKVVKFTILADPSSGLGGYVYNTTGEKGVDEWLMGMNIGFAYVDVTTQEGGAIPFNDNGIYGNIFTHELGHIITLNFDKQITFMKEGDACNHYRNSEGCSKPNSYVNLFNTDFYVTPPTNEPTHVTGYAKTNLEEDIAESFAHYVTQETTIPVSTNASSGALQKLNFIKGKSELDDLKSKIKTIYKLGYSDPGQQDILAKQVDKNGKPISCLNHKAILKALEKE